MESSFAKKSVVAARRSTLRSPHFLLPRQVRALGFGFPIGRPDAGRCFPYGSDYGSENVRHAGAAGQVHCPAYTTFLRESQAALEYSPRCSLSMIRSEGLVPPSVQAAGSCQPDLDMSSLAGKSLGRPAHGLLVPLDEVALTHHGFLAAKGLECIDLTGI